MRFAEKAAWTALLLLTPATAHGWGYVGHRVVAQIAANHLSEDAERAVAELLGTENLPRVAIWADQIRSDPTWKHAGVWHYISVEDGEVVPGAERNPDGDVLAAMDRCVAVLRNPEADRADRVEALKFLVHFVGDVHQPLHVGRRGDRGGNSVKVQWYGEPGNLHSVWDSGLIESQKLSYSEFAEHLDHPTAAQIAAWQGAGRQRWAEESKALRPRVYDIGDGDLGYVYTYVNLPLVEQRLLQAGVRLAGLLNEIFIPPPEQ